jgi:hypothetical protein
MRVEASLPAGRQDSFLIFFVTFLYQDKKVRSNTIGELCYQIALARKITIKLMVVVHKNEESLQETPPGRKKMMLLRLSIMENCYKE